MIRFVSQYIRSPSEHRHVDQRVNQAWRDFYATHDRLIRRYVTAMGLCGPDRDDCVQDVWTEFVRSTSDSTDPNCLSRIRGWFYVVSRNKAINYHRQTKRRRTTTLELESATTKPEADPKNIVHRRARNEALREAIARLQRELSETNARLLEMRLLERRKVSDVARDLCLTPQQVWYRQYRLLGKLRRRIRMNGEDL